MSHIELAAPLPGVKARADLEERTLLLSVSYGKTTPAALRAFLYGALNAYEDTFSVFIKGVPFCFLPDACDHILTARTAGKNRRTPTCARCRLHPVCPGLPAGPDASPRAEGLLKPVLEIPGEIVFELNRRCNLSCAVCSSRSLNAELPLRLIRSQLARARELGVKNIRFTGGEPFLHPRIEETLAAAKRLGFYVLVNTNATLLTPRLIERTAPFIDNILVSMQGFDAESEAAATGGKDLFEKKINNIRLLRRSKIPVLRFGTVISRDLVNNFGKYLALAEGLKGEIWELYRPMNGGAGGSKITGKDLRRLAKMLEPRMGLKPRTVFANPVPLCLFKTRQAPLFLGARFDDGHTRLVLDPRGFYKPSYYIHKNLGGDPLKAWDGGFLREISGLSWLVGKCRRCVFRLRCLGGSRFAALESTGNHLGKDPWLPRKIPRDARAPAVRLFRGCAPRG